MCTIRAGKEILSAMAGLSKSVTYKMSLVADLITAFIGSLHASYRADANALNSVNKHHSDSNIVLENEMHQLHSFSYMLGVILNRELASIRV